MSLSGEEQIVATPYDSGTKHETLKRGNIKVTTINKEETGLEESHLSVFLEVTGAGYKNERPGVDIVMVLDVGDSMKGEKLEAMKGVMRLLIDKLSSADRLSIVTVSKDPQKLCGLRQMSLISQAEIEKLVSGLETHPGKDVNGGLDVAYKVINDRKYATGRRAAILLMSDGHQFQVPIKHIFFQTMPVYTFGIGDDVNSMVLNDVAKHSDGGIHCPIDVGSSSPSKLRSAVAECFAKLFTVLVSDLKLTVKRAKSTAKIDNICVGTYSRSDIPFTTLEDNVIISFGDLYANETCKVEVDLHLFHVNTQQPCDLLYFSYSWRTMGEVFNSSSRLVRVNRVANLTGEAGSEQEKGETWLRDVDLCKIQGLFKVPKLPKIEFDSEMFSIPKRIYVSLVNLFWLLVSLVGVRTRSIFSSLSFDKFTNKSHAEVSKDEIESETSNQLLKRFWLQLINISTWIYKSSIPAFLGFLSLVSTRTEGMWNSLTIVLTRFRESLKSEAGINRVPAKKNDPSRATSLKEFGSQVIGNSLRIFKYLIPLLILFLILYGMMSKQVGTERPIKPVVIPRDVPPIIVEDIQYPVTDLRAYYCNITVGFLSNHLNRTLDSVTTLRDILNNYMEQHIKNQANGESSDLLGSKNIKALGEHIHLTFEWSKAIKKVLHNAERIPLYVTNWEAGSINNKRGGTNEKHKDSYIRKYFVCLLLLITSLVGIRAIFNRNVPKKTDRSVDPVMLADMRNQIKKAFNSVQIIRQILSDYVKQHMEFEEETGDSKDSVRSRNVKALGEHIQKTFNSVQSIEDILKQST